MATVEWLDDYYWDYVTGNPKHSLRSKERRPDDGKPIWTIFSIFSDKLYFEVVECRPGATSVIRHSQIFDNMIDAKWAVEQDAL